MAIRVGIGGRAGRIFFWVFAGVVLSIIIAGTVASLVSGHSYTPWKLARTVGDFFGERDHFDEGVVFLQDSGVTNDRRVDLPGDLADLSVDSYASVTKGVIFFPQWMAQGPGGGGFLYSPEAPPVGFDMLGTICTAPVDLGEGWWACGMDDPSISHGDWKAESRPPAWLWVGVFIALAGGALVDWQTRKANKRVKTVEESWVQAPAIVTSSGSRLVDARSIQADERKAQRRGDYFAWGGDRPLGYLADIRYEYVFGDETYVGTRVTLIPDYTEEGVESLVREYPVGARVRAYVNPSDPTDAVLTTDGARVSVFGKWFCYALGLLFLLVATGVIGEST